MIEPKQMKANQHNLSHFRQQFLIVHFDQVDFADGLFELLQHVHILFR